MSRSQRLYAAEPIDLPTEERLTITVDDEQMLEETPYEAADTAFGFPDQRSEPPHLVHSKNLGRRTRRDAEGRYG